MSPWLSDLFLSAQSDERLVSLARAGHQRAFAAIVERYRSELEALARRLTSDGRSEDVVQQTFLSAFAALSTGAEVRHLRGWLYQIVRNSACRPQGPPCVPLDGATASADILEDVVAQRALAMTTLTELGRLPTRQREAMIGTVLDGRPRAEIASSMGLSEGAVRQLVHRARTTLRSAVTALTPWPLARWLASVCPDTPGTAGLTAGAGAASSGGLALKLWALLASGTFLTGAAVELHGLPVHRAGAGARAAAPGRTRSGARESHSLVLAAARAAGGMTGLGTGRLISATQRVTPGAATRLRQQGASRHVSMPAGSGGRSDGQRLEGAAGNAGRPDRGTSTYRAGRGWSGPATPGSSGSDGHGQGGGTRSDGSGRSAGGSRTYGGTGSDSGGGGQDSRQGAGSATTASATQGPDSQSLADSQSLTWTSDGGSSSNSGSSSGTETGTTSATSSGSQSASGSDSWSGSGSGSSGSFGSGSGAGGTTTTTTSGGGGTSDN